MGNIVYVYNKPFVSDFNALQLEPARIRQMSLSNPTADGLSTPTTWQPPLPPDAPTPGNLANDGLAWPYGATAAFEDPAEL
jgi:hypothetical protein